MLIVKFLIALKMHFNTNVIHTNNCYLIYTNICYYAIITDVSTN